MNAIQNPPVLSVLSHADAADAVGRASDKDLCAMPLSERVDTLLSLASSGVGAPGSAVHRWRVSEVDAKTVVRLITSDPDAVSAELGRRGKLSEAIRGLRDTAAYDTLLSSTDAMVGLLRAAGEKRARGDRPLAHLLLTDLAERDSLGEVAPRLDVSNVLVLQQVGKAIPRLAPRIRAVIGGQGHGDRDQIADPKPEQRLISADPNPVALELQAPSSKK